MAAIIAVMMTARVLERIPSLMASSKGILASTLWRKTRMMMTRFWMQMPNRAMKPMPAEMLKFMPVICKAQMPPITAKGRLSMTSMESLTLPKVVKRIRKIAKRQMGTTTDRVFSALDGFRIEVPSWGFANTGTRFGKFSQVMI